MKSQLLNTPTAAQAEAGITFDPEVNGFDGPLKTGWASNVQTGDMHTFVTIRTQALESHGIKMSMTVRCAVTTGT